MGGSWRLGKGEEAGGYEKGRRLEATKRGGGWRLGKEKEGWRLGKGEEAGG
jgi:hypothetical protein